MTISFDKIGQQQCAWLTEQYEKAVTSIPPNDVVIRNIATAALVNSKKYEDSTAGNAFAALYAEADSAHNQIVTALLASNDLDI